MAKLSEAIKAAGNAAQEDAAKAATAQAGDSSSTGETSSTVNPDSIADQAGDMFAADPAAIKPQAQTPQDEPPKRKRGRPAGSGKKPEAQPLPMPGAFTAPAPDPRAIAESSATIATVMMERTCVAMMGEHWKMPDDERSMMIGAWADYFVARGVPTLPPEVALIGALSLYALPRMHDERTTTRLEKFGLWLRAKFRKG